MYHSLKPIHSGQAVCMYNYMVLQLFKTLKHMDSDVWIELLPFDQCFPSCTLMCMYTCPWKVSLACDIISMFSDMCHAGLSK